MLSACALKYGKSWDKSLPYVEFSYNNSYQAGIKMAPYEALYGRQCRTPLFWSQTGESQVFGLEVLKDVEKQVQMVRESLNLYHRLQIVRKNIYKYIMFNLMLTCNVMLFYFKYLLFFLGSWL
jgi:hypothetical protein